MNKFLGHVDTVFLERTECLVTTTRLIFLTLISGTMDESTSRSSFSSSWFVYKSSEYFSY